jgi:hypothetical protein
MTEQQEDELIPGLCCFYFRYGKCEPPRPPCRFRHEEDDGITPCVFGPTCRLGHAKRARVVQSEKLEYWREYNANDATVGSSPAVRDATLLRSQLEPWPTSVLRERLASVFGEVHRDLDPLGRGELMRKLLEHYKNSGPRKVIRVLGSPVREDLCDKLLAELTLWRKRHTTNTRPSINSKSYMILRSPMEFGQKSSNNAKAAAKKLSQNQQLWDLAEEAIREVDPEYAANFSALAVTYGFKGSPHIDKQNTGPFYGLAIGSFLDGQGGICVESSPLVVAHVNTKNRLGKVDGRFPHWVSTYDDQSKERYSLIYYSTWQEYMQPAAAFFGHVLPEEEDSI